MGPTRLRSDQANEDLTALYNQTISGASIGDPVYWNNSNSRWEQATSGTAVPSGVYSAANTVGMDGRIVGLSGLSAGSVYYLASGGGLTTSATGVRIGQAISSTELIINIDSDSGTLVTSVFGRTGNITAQSNDYTASQITNTPAGNISSTTVQTAINELDTEKLSTSLTSANFIVGNNSNVATAVAASGVVSLSNTGLFDTTKGADIASAGTINLDAATGIAVDITGTVTITSLGSNTVAGHLRLVRFTGSLTLTYNATSLILPTLANIVTANGDCAIFESLGSNNWKCLIYQRTDGTTLAFADASITLAKLATQADQTFLGNVSGGVASPSALTVTQVKTALKYYDIELLGFLGLS